MEIFDRVLPLSLQPKTVLAATKWASNAELIEAVRNLTYLRSHDSTLDPTWGEGVFWKLWRPDRLTSHHKKTDGSDFRNLPYPDGHFDAIAYDPPYVSTGSKTKTTVPEFMDRYGLREGGAETPDFETPEELQQLINDGLTEMYRLVKKSAYKKMSENGPNGIVLVKCMDYISSGKLFEGTYLTRKHAESLGFICWDRLEHLGDPGPQPKLNPDGSIRKQKHARRNLSTLFVFRKI